MALANLIDLIAEVAAKRTAREGKNDRDASEHTWPRCRVIQAFLRRRELFFGESLEIAKL
ncbi:hypothetical protein [Roseivivax isoporae]|uniref:Uncharacterized protein n=1 Tax=Roseivivax isoporae LMG 25204 TaxID=1449351 RepID=X7F104_9RHOB|nr:hypothetical protein [Roseivivax isoporae]ETX26557.1 hypothetical protein RISW2_22805 [Roseivivax isoporae LMG 25204]